MDPAAIDEAYRLEDDHWWYVGKRLLVAALLADVFGDPSLRLLDVGCGTGGVLAALKERTRIVGVDRSLRALGYSRRRGVAELACSEAHRLPFGRATFDGILLLDVLEHVVDDTLVLRDVRMLLAPGGFVLVSVPAFQFLWGTHDQTVGHVRRYRARALREALERTGFVVQRLTHTNVVAFPPAVVARAILGRLGLRRREGTDFQVHRPAVNRALIAAYRLEAAALRHIGRLPVGVSIAALATTTAP